MKTFALWFGFALFAAGFLMGFAVSPYESWTRQAAPFTLAAAGYAIIILTLQSK